MKLNTVGDDESSEIEDSSVPKTRDLVSYMFMN